MSTTLLAGALKKKPCILVVDDEVQNRILLEALLAPEGYDIVLAVNGLEAVRLANERDPDLVLLDVMMPEMNGFEAAKRIKQDPATSGTPIVMVTALSEVEDRVKAINAGADDFLSKPVDKTELRARVKSLIRVKAYNDHMKNYQAELEREVARQTDALREAAEKLKSASFDTILRLCRAAEFRDDITGDHILRISTYSAILARHLGMGVEVVETLKYASPLHDIGKIAMPDGILKKAGKLDDVEWELMRKHTIFGAQILSDSKSEFLNLAEQIARCHHEKWDGSGYPNGLRGADIPIAARIVSVVDVYDALTSARPYKEAFSIEKTFEIMLHESGKHFDPEVLNAFVSARSEVERAGANRVEALAAPAFDLERLV